MHMLYMYVICEFVLKPCIALATFFLSCFKKGRPEQFCNSILFIFSLQLLRPLFVLSHSHTRTKSKTKARLSLYVRKVTKPKNQPTLQVNSNRR